MQCHAPSCTATANSVCAACKSAHYCSRTCQTNAWKSHKKLCVAIARSTPAIHDRGCKCCGVGQRVPDLPKGTLIAASAEGDVSRVRELLLAGAEEGDIDEGLSKATLFGHVDVVAALCEAGACACGEMLLNAVTHVSKAKPADVPAAIARCMAVTTVLLHHGASPAESAALRFACQAGADDLVALLIEHGADVNAAGDHDGITPLHVAAEHASLRIVQLLLAAGANPTAVADCGWSALFYAVADTKQAGNLDVIRALIAGGAPVNIVSHTGSTPLWIASQVRRDGARGRMGEVGGGRGRDIEPLPLPPTPNRMAAPTLCSCFARVVQMCTTASLVGSLASMPRSCTTTVRRRKCCAALAQTELMPMFCCCHSSSVTRK